MLSEAELIEIEARAAYMEYIAEGLLDDFRRQQRGATDQESLENAVRRAGTRLECIHEDLRRLVDVVRARNRTAAA